MKQRTRLAAQAWRAPKLRICPKCGSAVPGHTACSSCGTYTTRNGAEVVIKAEV
ncbi:MAG: 50S ribosomal protein L32 [Akkermansiaceae bacterium]|nr:50S ribosomal protein L32 [Akkermansiaceae bacterium]MCD8071056.1 50S ribosomal protein L32 [Akkermansiaceae bacterium]